MENPEMLESRPAFDGRFVRVRIDRLRMPDAASLTARSSEHGNAVAVVPLHDDAT